MKWTHFAHTTFEPHFILENISTPHSPKLLIPRRKSMYIPSIPTQIQVHQLEGKGKRIMNSPQGRRLGAVVGLGVVGMSVLAAGKLMPSKKQTVVWGIGGELDKVNGEADVMREREAVFG